MSVQAMAWVLDSVRGLKPAERLVLLSIANHADKYGRNAWPSKQTIAEESDVRVETVERALRSLKTSGLVSVEVNAGGDKETRSDRRPNRYTVHMDVHMGGENGGGANDVPPSGQAPGGESRSDGGERNAPQTVPEPSTPLTPPSGGEPDSLRNELDRALTAVTKQHPSDDRQRRRRNGTLDELEFLEATPDDVRNRAARWRKLNPGKDPSASVLLKAWLDLYEKPMSEPCPTCNDRGIVDYDLPAEPGERVVTEARKCPECAEAA